jgi:hypothetical protein
LGAQKSLGALIACCKLGGAGLISIKKYTSYSKAMKPVQALSHFIEETAENLVHVFKRQIRYFVRLVTKQKKRHALSWENIIDECFPLKPIQLDVAGKANAEELSQANYHLAQLPQEIFDELLRRIQKNIVDEIQIIRLYEKLFNCEVKILRGHVHFYKCTSDKFEETIDYTKLISRLEQLFKDHKKKTKSAATSNNPSVL